MRRWDDRPAASQKAGATENVGSVARSGTATSQKAEAAENRDSGRYSDSDSGGDRDSGRYSDSYSGGDRYSGRYSGSGRYSDSDRASFFTGERGRGRTQPPGCDAVSRTTPWQAATESVAAPPQTKTPRPRDLRIHPLATKCHTAVKPQSRKAELPLIRNAEKPHPMRYLATSGFTPAGRNFSQR